MTQALEKTVGQCDSGTPGTVGQASGKSAVETVNYLLFTVTIY
jgi:hypothetical protein